MSDIPKTIARAELVFAGIPLVVHQLDNGERVIEGDAIKRLAEKFAGGELNADDLPKFRLALETAATPETGIWLDPADNDNTVPLDAA